MTILPFSHNGEHSFDDVDISEEVDLEDLVNEADCSAALSQFFNGTYDSCPQKILDQLSSLLRTKTTHLRSRHTAERQFVQTLPQPRRPLLGTVQRLFARNPVSVMSSLASFEKRLPAVQPDNSQMLPPSVRLLYILQERPKPVQLSFSFLKLIWQDTCHNIVAMFEDLSRQCDSNRRCSSCDEPDSWSVVRWKVW